MCDMKSLCYLLLLWVPHMAAADLLEDPGFEDQSSIWLIKNPKTAAVGAEAAHDGKLGLRLYLTEDGGRAQVDSALMPLGSSRRLQVAFWARTSGRQTGGVTVQVLNAARKPLLNEQGKPLGTIGIPASADWQRCEKEFTLPEDAAYLTLAIRSWTGQEGTIDLDDFEVVAE